MQVKLFYGSYAYAMIKHESGSLDIRLEPGRKASKSLREYCDEQENRAAAIFERVNLARKAAAILEKENR